MSPLIAAEVHRLGGDVSDEIWLWLLTRGPKGSMFTWSQTRGAAPGFVSVELLHEVAKELSDSTPDFEQRARQVAAVVGGAEELMQVKFGHSVDFPRGGA